MSRQDFALGKLAPSKLSHEIYTNKFHHEYVMIHAPNGELVCDYIALLHIEKTGSVYDNDAPIVPWNTRPEWKAAYTFCTNCYKMSDAYHDVSHGIKVDNSHDMLPLYMKWAMRLTGTKFDKDGWIDNTANGEHYHETLNKLYQNINGKFRLKNFSEHRCEKCKKEWIVFEEETTQLP